MSNERKHHEMAALEQAELCANCTPERDHNGMLCRSCANKALEQAEQKLDGYAKALLSMTKKKQQAEQRAKNLEDVSEQHQRILRRDAIIRELEARAEQVKREREELVDELRRHQSGSEIPALRQMVAAQKAELEQATSALVRERAKTHEQRQRAEQAERENWLLKEQLGSPDDPESWVSLKARVEQAERELVETREEVSILARSRERLDARLAALPKWVDGRTSTDKQYDPDTSGAKREGASMNLTVKALKALLASLKPDAPIVILGDQGRLVSITGVIVLNDGRVQLLDGGVH